jgi:UDP-glucuronate decarboxylase
MMTNIMGTKNMLEFAADRKAQFFQASTSECYGDALEVPQRENYFGNVNTVGPRACYDESKRMAETLCYEFKKNEGVKVKIARIFNTFSERISPQDGRIISNFVLQALRGENITVYGDGLQTRSLLYVDDAIEAYWNFMNKTPDDFTGPMNIGSEQEHTVLSIAKKIIELTHSQSKIIFCDLPQDDPLRRKPSLSLARKMINFEQKVSLADGIQKVIAEYRK